MISALWVWITHSKVLRKERCVRSYYSCGIPVSLQTASWTYIAMAYVGIAYIVMAYIGIA